MPPRGTITLTDGGRYLRITAPPQVAQRLVRIFNGARRDKDGAVIVTASDVNCHELEWAGQRWPLVPEGAAVDLVATGAERFRARQVAVEETRSEGYTPPTFDMALPPREYQRIAADLVWRSGGLLLADDVGLGKTVTAIAAMVAPGALPAIVVTLKHLCKQWERELGKFAPALRVHVLSKGTPYPLADTDNTEIGPSGRRRIIRNGRKRMPDVVVLNYHKLAGWRDELVRLGPGLVVFDEVQELRKGSDSYKGAAAYGVSYRARARLGLSATPIYNYGAEIRNVMEALAPGLLGDPSEFHQEWCVGGADGKARLREPEVMRAHLTEQGAMLRRTRREVGRELPPLQRVWQTVETDLDKLKDVADEVAELARVVLSTGGDPFAKMQAAQEMDWRLRQATGLAKVPGVVALVRMILDVEPDSPVLLYAHHHLVFDAYASAFDRAGIGHASFTGRESASQKETGLRAFIDGKVPILMMAVRSGAGIDGIQKRCRTVVFGELDWSPGVHIQAEGRPHRDGQAEPVTAFYAVSEDGSDPPMQDVLGLKEAQRSALVDGQASGAVLEGADTDRIKKLAAAYLERRGS